MASVSLTKWDLALLFGLEYEGMRPSTREDDDMDIHVFKCNGDLLEVKGYAISEETAKEAMSNQLLSTRSALVRLAPLRI
jgi:hypothetical protein